MMTSDSRTASAGSFLGLFFRLKWRMANNHLSGVQRHLWFHFALAMFALILLVGGGTLLFEVVFSFLMHQEVFGPLLMDQLVKMVFLAFFSMLIFSNFIIMMMTTYLSREVEFLMSQPVSYRRLFFGKLFESIVYSSWAFVIFSFPMFVAMWSARDRLQELGWVFFAGTAGLLIPFLLIPAALGAFASILITVYFPPRRLMRFAAAMAIIGVLGALSARNILSAQDSSELPKIMRFLSAGDILFLPSGWVGRGIKALENHQFLDAAFWGLALWSTAAMGLVLCDWLAGPLYYRGWCNARATASPRRLRSRGFYDVFDRLVCWLPRSLRALVAKDLTVFWRDPAQWGQLMILFGLLVIYFFNLRSASGLGRFAQVIPFWKSLVALFNIGATTFVLSILTTRFVFPMLSLEGRQQWVIGLAPHKRSTIVWEKFMLSWISSMIVTLPLAWLSCLMLDTDATVTRLSLFNVAIMSMGLSALAVGLGALMPNFNEDNPSRIASGLGGTITAILSLIYIVATLAVEGPWLHAWIYGAPGPGSLARTLLLLSVPGWIMLQCLMIGLPMMLGLSRWSRIEF